MEYSIIKHSNYFEIKLSKQADLRVYAEYINATLSHPDWTPGTPVLLDQTGLDTSLLRIGEVNAIADQCTALKAEIGAAKVALLVSRDMEYGMNRMWAVFIEDRWDALVGLFRSREEAVAWLGE